MLDEVQAYIEAERGEDAAMPDAISVPSMPEAAKTDPLHDGPEPNYEPGSVEDLIVRVPKAELHIHLAGTMTGPVFVQLLDKYRSWTPDLIGDWDAQAMKRYPALQPMLEGDLNPLRSPDLFQFEDMDQFGVTVRVLASFIRDLDDVALVATAAIENLERQNVAYAEFTFDLERFSRLGASMIEVGQRLDAISKAARIDVRWLADPGRDIGPEQAQGLVERLIDARFTTLAGISLSGRERDFPPRQFVDMYSLARDADLNTTIHAGELLGSDSIWHVVNELGVDRIGHGIRAADDAHLIDTLADDAIALEMCPTANVATGMYPTLTNHPIHDLFDAGVTVTLGSDYPTFFGTDLVGEYLSLLETGWAKNDLLEVVENGFLMAFIPDEEANHYLNRVHAIWEEE
jgi:adenosine deaminase